MTQYTLRDHLEALMADVNWRFHNTPNHGWMEIPRPIINALGIQGLISPLSYQDANNIYLEQHKDYQVLSDALRYYGFNLPCAHQNELNNSIQIESLPSYQCDSFWHYNRYPLEGEERSILLSRINHDHHKHTSRGLHKAFLDDFKAAVTANMANLDQPWPPANYIKDKIDSIPQSLHSWVDMAYPLNLIGNVTSITDKGYDKEIIITLGSNTRQISIDTSTFTSPPLTIGDRIRLTLDIDPNRYLETIPNGQTYHVKPENHLNFNFALSDSPWEIRKRVGPYPPDLHPILRGFNPKIMFEKMEEFGITDLRAHLPNEDPYTLHYALVRGAYNLKYNSVHEFAADWVSGQFDKDDRITMFHDFNDYEDAHTTLQAYHAGAYQNMDPELMRKAGTKPPIFEKYNILDVIPKENSVFIYKADKHEEPALYLPDKLAKSLIKLHPQGGDEISILSFPPNSSDELKIKITTDILLYKPKGSDETKPINLNELAAKDEQNSLQNPRP